MWMFSSTSNIDISTIKELEFISINHTRSVASSWAAFLVVVTGVHALARAPNQTF
jgi:hypothetical protein